MLLIVAAGCVWSVAACGTAGTSADGAGAQDAGADGGLPTDALDASEAGSLRACATVTDCPPGEVCAFPTAAGCVAKGVCRTAKQCGVGPISGCTCDGTYTSVVFCQDYENVIAPTQSLTPCGLTWWNDDAGACLDVHAACGSPTSANCCSPLQCYGELAGCCAGLFVTCRTDEDCCPGMRCSGDDVSFARCVLR